MNKDAANEAICKIMGPLITTNGVIDGEKVQDFCTCFTIAHYLTKHSAEFASYMVHEIESFAEIPEVMEIKCLNLAANVNSDVSDE